MSDAELRSKAREGLTPKLMRERHRAMLCPLCGEKERHAGFDGIPEMGECCCKACWYSPDGGGTFIGEQKPCPGCPAQ